jgi:putative addiction module component (TIGR02574 family)
MDACSSRRLPRERHLFLILVEVELKSEAMDDNKKFLAAALELPEHERAELATRLLESLDHADQDGVDEAWAREIERRCAALDSGDAVTSDWNDFRARIERDIF